MNSCSSRNSLLSVITTNKSRSLSGFYFLESHRCCNKARDGSAVWYSMIFLCGQEILTIMFVRTRIYGYIRLNSLFVRSLLVTFKE
jgi:hypothetical protein